MLLSCERLCSADLPVASEEQRSGRLKIQSTNSRCGCWINAIGSQHVDNCCAVLLLLRLLRLLLLLLLLALLLLLLLLLLLVVALLHALLLLLLLLLHALLRPSRCSWQLRCQKLSHWTPGVCVYHPTTHLLLHRRRNGFFG